MRVNLRDTSSTLKGNSTSTKLVPLTADFSLDNGNEGVDTLVDHTRQQTPADNEFNALKHWLSNVAQHELLSKEEEIELAKRIEQGDESAREELIRANLRLVIAVASKYKGLNVPLEDLIQEGNIGLIKATSKYNYELGYKFSTYAIWWVRQAVLRALDNYSRTIRVPGYMNSKMNALTSLRNSLYQNLQREPTIEELAQHSGISLTETKEIWSSNINMSYLDSVYEETEKSIVSFIEDEDSNPERNHIQTLINQDLTQALLQKLPVREREILKLRLGLENGEEKTLKEIGQVLNVTRERVRQIESEALSRLRELYDENGDFRQAQSNN